MHCHGNKGVLGIVMGTRGCGSIGPLSLPMFWPSLHGEGESGGRGGDGGVRV